MGGATEEPMGGEGEGTNEPTGGEPTAPTRPMGTGEPTGEDTMVVTYKPMEEDPVEELTSWPTQKPTINDIGEGTDSPTGGLIEEPPRDGLGMDLSGNTTISLKIGGVGWWLGQWRQGRRQLAWRRRQRWIAAQRWWMTGLIEGDLGIAARRGQRTSTAIPRGAVDSLDCGDRRVFAGAMTILRHPSPNRWRIRGQAMSCAARVWTTPQRERTAGSIVTTMGGPGNGDINVEALAVRATHC